MNMGLIIFLIAVLLILVIGYNVMLQYKTRVEVSRRQESAKYNAIIEATEDLIGNAHHIPFSLDLLLCLHTRILDAATAVAELDPKNKTLTQRVESMKQQIAQLKENYSSGDTTAFKVPSSDKQAIVMLKLVKRLRDTIRSEHNKGRFNTQSYVTENARLETIQLRINIENVMKRANDAVVRGQVGTARQLLKKGIDVLTSRTDNYSLQAKDKLSSMLDELNKNSQAKQAENLEAQEEKERNSDMEALFGEKKKW